MKNKTAGFLFLGVCMVLAVLLLTKVIGTVTGAAIFAIALVILGLLSSGFGKRKDSSTSI